MVAMRTMTSAPFSTGCPAPLKGVSSVAVKPGSTALVAGPKPLKGLAMTELPRLLREVHAAGGNPDD